MKDSMKPDCITLIASVGDQKLREEFCGPNRHTDSNQKLLKLAENANDKLVEMRVYDHNSFWHRLMLKFRR